MTSPPGRDAEPTPDAHRQRSGWWPVVGVYGVFLTYSAICRPVPSVNEPHYLTKAKHYWQSDWCAGDFFLESSNPHLVFYQTIGALTQWLSLPQAAWAGRVITLALLAWGWTRLTSRLSSHRWAPLIAACLFLLLQSLGNFSGEWLVGGVEAKVPAYAFAFLGWASLIDRRPVSAGSWLGLAMSFHPVVGGWCVIAAGMATILRRFWHRGDEIDSSEPSFPLMHWMLGGAALLLFALPGVIPALQTLTAGDPAAATIADRYQVGTRLAHHLDPMTFPVAAYRYYALLILIWLMMRRSFATTAARRWFVVIAVSSLIIALVGVIVSWGPRPIKTMPLAGARIWLLKFYPFRLADLLIPMLVAVTTVEAIAQWRTGDLASPNTIDADSLPRNMRGWRGRSLIIVSLAAFAIALGIPNTDTNASRMTDAQQADWRAACHWVRTQTPPDAMLYAANEHWAVKWFCHRPEYVNYKDCPQEAAGIIEWARRLKTLNRWHKSAFRDGHISAAELHQLHDQTGITHLLVSRLGPIDTDPSYQNDSFRVYAITP